MSRDDAPPGIPSADHLYRGFPAFSAWGKLPAADADLWNRFAAGLAQRRQQASPESLQHAVEVAVRAAALDTGALEGLYSVDRGFTMTVAVQGLAWQQMVEERGAGVRELFEAQLAAYELVLDAVTQKLPITEAWIRALHGTLCAPQRTYRVLTDQGWQEQELPQGQYKTRPNHVHLTDGTVHAYAPVDQVATEMHRFIEQIRTPEFESAHAVLQASYSHYAFVSIHPFADGNGRVARALASTFFYRAQSIPLLIFANQRPAYLDALALADSGASEEVIEFFRDRGIDTMQLVSESLRTAEGPRPEQQAKGIIDSVSSNKRSPSEAELKLTLYRILQRIGSIFGQNINALNSPHISGNAVLFPIPEKPPASTYRPFGEGMQLVLQSKTLQLAHLLPIIATVDYATSPNPFPIVIRADRNEDELDVRLEDVYPELTPNFRLRLDQWVQRQLGRMLAEIAESDGSNKG
jgi:Fic family protein